MGPVPYFIRWRESKLVEGRTFLAFKSYAGVR